MVSISIEDCVVVLTGKAAQSVSGVVKKLQFCIGTARLPAVGLPSVGFLTKQKPKTKNQKPKMTRLHSRCWPSPSSKIYRIQHAHRSFSRWLHREGTTTSTVLKLIVELITLPVSI